MATSHLHELARLGAQARLEALDREREEILDLFPDLRAGTSGRSPAKVAATPAPAPQGRSGRMSPEARKAQSERMSAYWAARRAAKAAAAGAASEGGSQGAGSTPRGRKSRNARKGSRK
jgi:hypothetical protein